MDATAGLAAVTTTTHWSRLCVRYFNNSNSNRLNNKCKTVTMVTPWPISSTASQNRSSWKICSTLAKIISIINNSSSSSPAGNHQATVTRRVPGTGRPVCLSVALEEAITSRPYSARLLHPGDSTSTETEVTSYSHPSHLLRVLVAPATGNFIITQYKLSY